MAAFSCLADGGTAIALSDDDVTAIVDKHNQLRSNVTPSATNMLKMTWNEEAAKNARDVAKTCPEEHSTYSARKVGTIFCGENIFVSTHEINLKEAIQAWYNEVRNFDFTTQPLNEEQKMALLKLVGHYTQVVWHNSKEIGCAQVFCPDLELPYILVCHYCPAGNTDITKPYETGKSCEKCPNHCEDNLCSKWQKELYKKVQRLLS
ncbi:cysteine-rich venom protein ENH2-like [Cheilinus undulatus]|uniref:cysteine-rich venom protein ENH2-like n=1 Tax=Cheilinus undulatus TaxID=241271 RepID=UPI001BD62EB1|nr:cysteine-rich venom protein ENH2-like [Cheilinus undulatus]